MYRRQQKTNDYAQIILQLKRYFFKERFLWDLETLNRFCCFFRNRFINPWEKYFLYYHYFHVSYFWICWTSVWQTFNLIKKQLVNFLLPTFRPWYRPFSNKNNFLFWNTHIEYFLIYLKTHSVSDVMKAFIFILEITIKWLPRAISPSPFKNCCSEMDNFNYWELP